MPQAVDIIISFRDKFSAGIRKVKSEMKGLGQEAKGLGARLKTVQGALGAFGLAAGGAAVVAAFSKAVGTFKEFDDTMRAVGAVSGATTEELQMLRDTAEKMGAETRFSASEAADGLRLLSMAGLSAADSIEVLPSVLQLASAGMVDLGTAADIATNVMSAFGLTVEELPRVNDVLVKTFTSTNTPLGELGEAFKLVGPIAKGLGADFEDLNAALGQLGNAGLKGSLAGTSLRGALNALFNPTKEEAKLMEDLSQRIGGAGLQIKNAEGGFIGFVEVIKQLEQAALTGDEALRLFGQRAGPGIAALLQQGSKSLEDLREKLRTAGGTAERIAQQMEAGLGGAFRRLLAATEGVSIALIDLISPALNNIIDSIAKSLSSISQELKNIQKNADTKAVLAGLGTIVGWLFRIIGFLGKITVLFSPITNAIKSLGRFTLAWRKAFPKEEIDKANDGLTETERKAQDASKAIGTAGFEAARLANNLEASNEEVAAFEKQAKKVYKAAIEEAKKYGEEVLKIEQEIALSRLSAEDRIRELRRRTLSETEQFEDKQIQAAEKLKAAREAAAEGDIEGVRRFTDQAKNLYSSLAGVVEEDLGGGTKTVIKDINETTDVAIQGIRESQAVLEEALGAQADKIRENQSAAQELADTAKEALDEIAGDREANVTIELENLEQAQSDINDLIKDETKRIRIEVEKVEKSQTGGFIPRSKKLSGYGGGDRIKALLEGGEYIMRKEAVRKYGAGMMEQINAMKFKLGGLVDNFNMPKLQTGGAVSSSELKDFGRVDIVVGDRAFPVLAQAGVVEQLKEHITRENLTRSN